MKKLKLFFACLLMAVLSIGQVWAATTLVPVAAGDLENGDYLITATKSSAEYMLPAGTFAKGKATAASLTSSNYSQVWTFTKNGNAWDVTTSNGEGLGITATNNGVICAENAGTAFTISATANNATTVYMVASDGTDTRYLTLYKTDDWRCYKTTTNANADQVRAIQLYKLEESGSGSGKTDVTDEQLAWSAENAEVTMGEEPYSFPSLTNTLGLDVTYQSTAEAVATIDANGNITLVKAGSTTIKAVFAGNETLNAKTVSYDLTVNPAPLTPIAGGVIDVLTGTWTGVGGTGYNDVDEDAPTSDAHYVGNCASNKGAYIQLRTSNSKEGIVSSVSGGKVKRVEVVWNSTTSAGRTLDVYGSNTEYTAATELYGSSPKGTKIGSIVCGTSTYFDVEGDYAYVGFRSNNGAMYMDEVRITWMPAAKYAVNIASVENGALAVKDGDDAITSGAEFTEGKTLTVVATPNDGFKLDGIKVIETGSNPENDVTSTVLSGTTLTVPAHAVTVSAEFSANEASFATLTLSEIGEETVYYDDDSKREGDIVPLPLTAASCSKVFRGWDPDENCATAPEYAPGESFTLGASASNKLYAVYATPIVDTESEPELAQTHLYDTWTYSGPAADKDSYRLFGNGAYVESDEFDLSTLAKVIVYGGTYGGGTYNSFTIGDGTNTWKNGTVTGTNKAGVNIVTDGTPLSGIGKLYVTSTCGNGDGGNSGNGIRISKVEIYTYGTTYGDYSTACLAKVDAPTFPVEQKEYTAAQNITISAVKGATIHYTTDGSIPTSTSATYSEPIELKTRGEYTIKAIAVKDGLANSDVVTAHYSINLPFANLADLVAAELADGSEVIVSFADEVITYKGSKYISLTTKDANDNTIQIYHSSAEMPEAWVVGGKVAATSKRFTWTLFGESQWELVPVGEFAWATGLAYTAPAAIESLEIRGNATEKTYIDGQAFDHTGLTAWAIYSDTHEEEVTALATWTYNPAKLSESDTEVTVTATYAEKSDDETVTGLIVNPIPNKTIAEFIEDGGGRCYLIGTVSNITNTTYGNFDLTDASGSIYVYGCLDTEGASKNFASLGIEADDYIKVIAETYGLYGNPAKHEAIDVQFVEELEKPDVPVTSVSVDNATVKINKTVQLTANVLPINASNKNVTWSVKEGSEAYAEVSATGVVTGKAEGNAVIVATSVADNTKFGECTVTVTGGINFAAGDFVLVEDAAELTEGTYVIVAGAGENNVAMKYHAGNSDGNHKGKAAVKEGKYLHYDADFGVYEIKDYVVEEVKQGISFYNENAENYFALPGNSNQLKTSTEQDNNSSWTAAVSEGVTTLTNKALPTRTLRYNINGGSPIFACYTSGQQPIALYKYVTPAAYRVYYNDNVTEEEIEVPAYQSVNGENKVTITTVEPVRDGYLFGGWKDGEANVYEAGVEYTLSADLTLYAQWTTATVSTLSYNPNGGTIISGETAIAPANVAEGTNLTIEANVYEKGDNFVFAGWQLGDDVYQPGDPFVMPATDVEFVAKWDAVEVSDYTLVTDVAQLQAWDKIIIVAANYNVAAGSAAATYRNPVTIGKTASKNKLILAGYGTPTEFTLGIPTAGEYTFNDGDGYMYESAAKSIKVREDSYSWSISIDGEAIATITGTNALQYNATSGQERFTTYESSQKDLQLYRKPGAAPEPSYTEVRGDLTVGRYYTVCLPKKVIAIKGASFWTLNNKSQDGATAYLEEETNNLPFAAGKPFIIQATADKLEVVYEGEATETPGVNGAIHGTLTYMDAAALAAAGSDVYMLFSNELRPVGENNHLDANRAYVKVGELNSVSSVPQGAPGKRVVAMPMQKDQAQGFENLDASEKPLKVMIDGTLYILRGEKVYDATGRLVK